MDLEKHDKNLLIFKKQDLNDDYQRRLAYFTLLDYYKNILFEVGIEYCGFPPSVLRACSVKQRWEYMSKALSEVVKPPQEWTKSIKKLHKLRGPVSHNESIIPLIQDLESLYKKALDFKEWVVAAGHKYHQAAKRLPLIQKYQVWSKWYVKLSEFILDKYGENIPYSVTQDFQIRNRQEYDGIQNLSDMIESRVSEIASIQDLNRSDFDNLLNLVRIIERIDAREGVYLEFSRCPKCGCNIIETQTSIYGCETDPAPAAALYRTGCEKCDFDVDSERIKI